MPELRQVALQEIDEPALAIRCSMDEQKLAELAESMRLIGLVQPIALKAKDGRYEIEAGHRRFLAAVQLGWREITAMVYQPGEIAEGAAMLAENIFREDITAAEEAVWFAELVERFKLDEAGLCAMVRRSPDYVGQRFSLLRGDPEVFNALRERKLNFSVARLLNQITDEAMRRYYLNLAQHTDASARQVQSWVNDWRAQAAIPTPPPAPAAAPTPAGESPAPALACFLCGGDKDPWNLVTVQLHKWELAQIHKMLREAAEVGG